jgi:hypothetical protein
MSRSMHGDSQVRIVMGYWARRLLRYTNPLMCLDNLPYANFLDKGKQCKILLEQIVSTTIGTESLLILLHFIPSVQGFW